MFTKCDVERDVMMVLNIEREDKQHPTFSVCCHRMECIK